jgi:glucose-specific phosphotransferase system IIA component
MVIGCGDEDTASAKESSPTAKQVLVDATPKAASGTVTIYAPLNGEIKLCSQVNDPTFAEGILGQGAAIIPSEGKLYAPFDCTVASLFDTHHAINLEGDGVEMLIHILNGKGFTPHVKDGDQVKTGDLLIEFDLEALKKDFDTITPILVTNADDFAAVEQTKQSGTVKVGDPILNVKR